jgi:hypothetical protein
LLEYDFTIYRFGALKRALSCEDKEMTVPKLPQLANGAAPPRLGSVASVLAQSKVVAEAFGQTRGFVLMMTALLIILSVSLTAALVITKGAAVVFGSLAKFGL